MCQIVRVVRKLIKSGFSTDISGPILSTCQEIVTVVVQAFSASVNNNFSTTSLATRFGMLTEALLSTIHNAIVLQLVDRNWSGDVAREYR
jgi:hypothetical protein